MLSRVLLIALVLLVSISCALSFQGGLANGKSLKIAPTSAGKVGPLMSAVEEPMDYFDKADKYKEDSRKFRRNVFGHPEWRNHRSSKRYWKNLRTTFNSGVIQGLLLEVLSVVTIATFVCGYNAWVGGETPLGVPDAFPFGKLEAPALPFTLSSPALGLLLVFRTNSAYARWWDARIQWGFTINRTRDFVRNGLCFFNSKNGYANTPEVIAQKTRFTHLVIAYARSVKGHFRDGQDEEDKLYSEFVGLLGQEDADKIMEAKHRPMRIVQELSTVVNNANMNDVQLSTIDRNLSGFCDTVGVCERIFKTPMPLVYTRHTSRFLAIWLLFLPLTLYKELGDSYLHLATIPVSFLIAVFFLGIEELGIQIEEPFSVLPMEVMCDGIEGSCKEMLANDIAMSAPLAPATTTAFSGLPQAVQKAAEPVAK